MVFACIIIKYSCKMKGDIYDTDDKGKYVDSVGIQF